MYNSKTYYEFPYEINDVDSLTNIKLLKDFKGERTGFVQVGNNKYFFPKKFQEQINKYYNVEVREDDIWIVTFPRSGTTLTQELVWLLSNDLDYKQAKEIELGRRSPFFELGILFHDDVIQEVLDENSHSEINKEIIYGFTKHAWEEFPKMKSPRIIKTHLPFSLLPRDWNFKNCKTIYIFRNPKDVIVSFYHLNRLIRNMGYQGTLEQFWEYFKANLQYWSPYWSHINEAWNKKNQANILFLSYENMITDIPKTIKQVATFLGKTLTEDQVTELSNHLSFENFKKNESVNMNNLQDLNLAKKSEEEFIRKGKINQSKDELTPELSQKIDQWVKENLERLNMTYIKLE